MKDDKIWADIERTVSTTGEHPDDVYAELMVDFGKLVGTTIEEGCVNTMAGRPEIKLDVAILKRMYEDGVKLRLIALYFGVSTSKIRKTRNELNLPLRKIVNVVYNENEFKRLFEAGTLYKEMARQLGMSRCSVIVIKNRLNLPNRNNLCKKVSHDR